MSTATLDHPSALPKGSRDKNVELPVTPQNKKEVFSNYETAHDLLNGLVYDTQGRYKAILVNDRQVDAIIQLKERDPKLLQSYVLRATNAKVMEKLNKIFRGNDRTKSKSIQEIGKFPGMNDKNREQFKPRFDEQMKFLEKSVEAAAKRDEIVQVRFFSNQLTNHYGFGRLRRLQDRFPSTIQGTILLENGQEFPMASAEADAYKGYSSPEVDTAVTPPAAPKQSFLGRMGRGFKRLFGGNN